MMGYGGGDPEATIHNPHDGFGSMLQRSIVPSDQQATVERRRATKPSNHEPSSEKSSSHKPASNTLASHVLFAVVVLAPLPFGSVDALPIVAWCVALGLALTMASLRALDRRHFLILAGVGVVVAAYLLVLHEQLAARPFFAVSPDPVWRAAADVLDSPLPPSLSMVRDQPLFALGAPLAAMLCLLVSFIVCIDRRRAHQLLSVVAWSGSAYALFGIAAWLIDPGHVLWTKKQAYFTVLTATFINRNTAAVYFGACAIVWLLILMERLRQRLPDTRLSLAVIGRSLQDLGRKAVIDFVAFFLCFVAMFLTGSRAGVVFSLLAAVIAVGLFVLKTIPLGRGALRLVLAAGCGVFILTQVLGAGVMARFDIEGVAGGGRPETYRSTLAIIEDHPWLGTGLGTFASVFPAYRSSAGTSWGVWERAHSTPLEIASDMGLPLAGIVMAAWAGVFAVLGHGLRVRNRDHFIVVAALAVATLAITHSLIDFSLQIPGFALVVLALVGAGLAQSFRMTRAA
jgi:O-antigen ligase